MHALIGQHNLILTEAAIVERLRRAGRAQLHPSLIHATLVYDDEGRAELETLYRGYTSIASAVQTPMLLTTPTWRANSERVQQAKVSPKVNVDCARFMFDLRDSLGPDAALIKVGGFIGCQNDAYLPEEGLSAAESESFHSWQIAELAEAGVEFLMAGTLPNVQEALGIAKAMEKTGTPYIIGFVIDREGRILDGTSLWDAVNQIDSATAQQPIFYMITCSYPTFLCAEGQPKALFIRLLGYQANASSLSHSELDGAAQLQRDDVADWVKEMVRLHRVYGMRVLGGCCGTDDRHLSSLARAAAA
jgi:S-methylmethionine-dependent homocysteine/selenocysteine methylase